MIVNQFFYLVPVFLFLDNLDGRIADFLLLRLGPVQHVVVLHSGVQLYNLYNLTPDQTPARPGLICIYM